MTLLLAFSRALGSFPCVYFELSLTSRAISLVPLLIETLCSLRETQIKADLTKERNRGHQQTLPCYFSFNIVYFYKGKILNKLHPPLQFV